MFLKYLLDKKLINSDQGLMATVEYLSARPSLLECIQAEGILDADRIMELYCKAGIEEKSFVEVFSRESGLTQTDLNHLYKVQQRSGKSFSQIIVERGFLSQDKLENALHEYLKTNPMEQKSVSTEKAEVPTNVEDLAEQELPKESSPVAPAGISAAALESLKEVSGLDPAQLSELEAQIDEADKNQKQVVEPEEESSESNATIENDDDDCSIYREEYFSTHNEDFQSELLVITNRHRLKKRESDLSLLHQNLTKVLSLAKLSGFSYMEKLLTPYDTLINNIMDNVQDSPDHWEALAMEMLDLLWRFRTLLFEGQTESVIMNDIDLKKKYIQNIKGIMSYIKREK